MTNHVKEDQFVFFAGLPMSQVVHTEALARLLIKSGVLTKDEFLEMVKVVNQEMKKRQQGRPNQPL